MRDDQARLEDILRAISHAVYRDPIADPAAPFGWRYGSTSRLGPRDFVSPLAARTSRVAVADLLP